MCSSAVCEEKLNNISNFYLSNIVVSREVMSGRDSVDSSQEFATVAKIVKEHKFCILARNKLRPLN